MYLIKESRTSSGTKYHISSENRNTTVCVRCIRTELAVEDGGTQTVSVFYDDQWRILYAPSLFLLDEMRWDSENTRLQAASALKLLLSFSSIIGVYPQDYEMSDARAFVRFARGTLGRGFSYSFKLKSTRSEATLAAYLAVIRRYVSFLGVKDSPFTKKKAVGRKAFGGRPEGDDYVISANPNDTEAPLYISVEEYRRIIAVATSGDGSAVALCIIRLMYEHGLRIGEVLGLTIEDLKMRIVDGAPAYSVILRNRVTDRPDQHAKCTMNVTSAADYGTADYRKRDVGYQEVRISENLYHALVEYAEAGQALADGEKAPGNCAADSVEGRAGNRYLFLNSRGGRLTAILWGKRLRKIFVESSVHVDSLKRRTNLNHRFRHGYAMFLIDDKNLCDLDVKTLMRHKSLRSTAIYHRPTEKDLFELQELATRDMHAVIFGGRGPSSAAEGAL